MKKWIFEQAIAYLISNLTEDNVKKIVEAIDDFIKPKIIDGKEELYAWIDVQVADTETPIDDLMAEFFKKIVDNYIK